jgi:hypothetical protein
MFIFRNLILERVQLSCGQVDKVSAYPSLRVGRGINTA